MPTWDKQSNSSVTNPSTYKPKWGYKREPEYISRYEPQRLILHPMVKAVKNSDEAEVRHLLLQGVDPNMKDDRGNSLLQLASLKNDIDMIRLLISFGASPNGDVVDRYSLNTAIDNNNYEIVKILLEAGASVDVYDRIYTTLLHEAVNRNNADIVALLLDYDADPSITNLKGLNAYQYAADLGHDDLALFMLKYKPNRRR